MERKKKGWRKYITDIEIIIVLCWVFPILILFDNRGIYTILERFGMFIVVFIGCIILTCVYAYVRLNAKKIDGNDTNDE